MSNTHTDQTCRLTIRTLNQADYDTTHYDMLNLTLKRIEQKRQNVITSDELWVVEHNDVYTLGQAGKEEHILQRGNTPIIKTDRGGQVTWHGKGQLVVYWMFDLNTLGWGVRDLVSHAEQSIEDVLNEALLFNQLQPHKSQQSHQTTPDYYAKARRDAPGVYLYSKVTDSDDIMLGKIASLGFKIKHGFSYHGIALNLNCDLSAFNAINPCGYAGMQMLRLIDFVPLRLPQPLATMVSNPDTTKQNAQVRNLTTQSPATSEWQVSQLQVTQYLIDNIKQRQAGDIALRLASNMPHR